MSMRRGGSLLGGQDNSASAEDAADTLHRRSNNSAAAAVVPQPYRSLPTVASSAAGVSRWLLWMQLGADFSAAIAVLSVFLAVVSTKARQVYMVTATLYTHSYARQPSSVPGWAVPIYSLIAPALAFTTWKVVERRRNVSWYDWYRTTYAFLFNFVFTSAIIDCLKVAIARPRPNWFYQCWPNGTIVWQHGTQNEFGGLPQCQDPSSMSEYCKSFPSGHSSMSASGLGFLSFWMMGQLNVFVGSGAPQMWSFLVSMVPFLAAIVVGITRITDHWHSVSDVCFGLLIGYTMALLCYLQVFPFFTHPLSHVPRYVLEEARCLKADDTSRSEQATPSGTQSQIELVLAS